MKHYVILSNLCEDKLASEVEELLNNGWEVGGNLIVSNRSDGSQWFYQPMRRVSGRGRPEILGERIV